MKVKIQINDKAGLDELLAKDPEIEIKIKEALVDAIGKRVAKIANEIIQGGIDAAARQVVEKATINNDFFTVGRWNVTLKQPVIDTIEGVIRHRVKNLVAHQVEESSEYKKIEASIAEATENLENLNPEKILRNEAYQILKGSIRAMEAVVESSKLEAEKKK